MRSLSPAPRRYSSFGAGAGVAGFLSSLSFADTGVNAQSAARATAASDVTRGLCVMAFATSVLFAGRSKAAAPVDDGPRERLALQRIGVDGVGRIARGPDGDAEVRREFVVL